jgi:opacity protein-like surface antigen
MKYAKASIIALTIALASSAHAADALDPTRVRFGINLGIGGPIAVGFSADASINNITQIAPGVGLGARLSAGYVASTFTVSAAPVATFRFDQGGVWLGPAVAFSAAPGGTAFGFGLTSGVEYDVNQQIMVYGGVYLGVVPSISGQISAGVDIDFTSNLSGFFETRTTFSSVGTGFGLGAGVAFRF